MVGRYKKILKKAKRKAKKVAKQFRLRLIFTSNKANKIATKIDEVLEPEQPAKRRFFRKFHFLKEFRASFLKVRSALKFFFMRLGAGVSKVVLTILVLFGVIGHFMVKKRRYFLIGAAALFLIALGSGLGVKLYLGSRVAVIEVNDKPIGVTEVFADEKKLVDEAKKDVELKIEEELHNEVVAKQLEVARKKNDIDAQVASLREKLKKIKNNKTKRKLRSRIEDLQMSKSELDEEIMLGKDETEVIIDIEKISKKFVRKNEAVEMIVGAASARNINDVSFGWELLREKLQSGNDIKYNLSLIEVAGTPVCYLASPEEAVQVVDYFVNNLSVGAKDAISEFEEKVEIIDNASNIERVVSVGEAINMLLSGKSKLSEYKVKKTKEDISGYAETLGVSARNLRQANPSLDFGDVKKGDTIRYYKKSPYVHFLSEGIISGNEDVMFKTKKIKDSRLFVGETKVKRKGKKGRNAVVKHLKLLNGKIVETETIKSDVIEKPVTQLLRVGTRKRPRGISEEFAYGGSSLSNPLSSLSVSSNFGEWRGYAHRGIDFQSPYGTPIYASAAGNVTMATYDGSYGNIVRISHARAISTGYAHMSSIVVSAGQHVSRGQLIGYVGTTGNSTGPHLHFEVLVAGTVVNPWGYLR